MTRDGNPRAMPLALVILALYVAYDLGAQQTVRPGNPSPAPDPQFHFSPSNSQHVSVQVDVLDPAGQVVFDVPNDRTFLLRDLFVTNTAGNPAFPNAGNIYPSLTTTQGEGRLSGTNLMAWPKGNIQTQFGGGGLGLESQAGIILTGGVVFEPGSSVVVHDYMGPLYFDGVLVP